MLHIALQAFRYIYNDDETKWNEIEFKNMKNKNKTKTYSLFLIKSFNDWLKFFESRINSRRRLSTDRRSCSLAR